jgi:CDP-diacylglycerol--serine O-phosphatidyltransferase
MKNQFSLILKRPLPDLVTLTGTIPFILSLFFVLHGKPELALLFSVVNFFIDSVDGAIARKLNVASDFGRQLDSYLDALIYLVFPALFMIEFFNANQVLTLATAIIIISAGILRLVRFNIVGFVYQEEKPYYSGLGTAYILLAVSLLFIAKHWLGTAIDWLAPLVLITMSVAMISEIPIRKPKLSFWYAISIIITLLLLALLFKWI